MNNKVKSASNLFFAAGILWVLEAISEIFGGYVEDFNNVFDYLSESTFGLYFAAFFLGAFYLTKSHQEISGRMLGWGGRIGLALLGLGAVFMTAKSAVNVIYHGFIGDVFLFAESGPLNFIFLIGVLSFVLGTIVFTIGCMTGKVLPWWVAALFILSLFFVFVPVFGKYVAAALYSLIGTLVLKKQENIEDISNNFIVK
ncbi:hypothetical protein [Bacillus sp. FJAT-29814]|uniref:hypothetical protein n=1 Tax=Bacillus sp. FJAT-29814 TaxID=1729688 RepID=UPI00083508CF|nr:hypothetical protein [Bacillus sp. FJAT-29814]